MINRVVKNPKEANKKGRAARKFLQENFSMTKIATIMRDRVVDIVKKSNHKK